MNLFFDLLLIVFLFSLFAVSHTILAGLKIKEVIRKNYPQFLPYYRAAYNIVSLISFYLFYLLSPKPNQVVYDLPNPFDMLILIPQFASLFAFLWTTNFINSKEFLGISQIERALKNNYDSNSLDEILTFRIEGPYKYSRHPMYLFLILFLLLRPTMDLFYFVSFILITIYFYLGSIYEEKKLVKIFGDEYINYQKNVPRIFPKLL